MLELTDKIRNTVFQEPLKSENVKHFIEHYALAALQYCFSERYNRWLVLDSPDLQSPDNLCGIEVTEIDVKSQHEIASHWQYYQHSGDSKYISIAARMGATIDSVSCSYPVVTAEDELSALETAFYKKMQKVPQYRENGFGELGLIIVMNEMPIPTTVFQWHNRIRSILESSKVQYDIVFFLHRCCLRWIVPGDLEPHHIVIPPKDDDALGRYARSKVELV